jgi:ribosomal protein S18 acetylase RimI-like enzyme
MIKILSHKDPSVTKTILEIQIPSYQVEAELISFDGIPGLFDTVESLSKVNETFYGYFIDNKLCGAISFKAEGGLLDIHRLIVHPHHFRKGIAKSLLHFVLSEIPDINNWIVRTGAKNLPAVNLYLKTGFIIEEIFEAAPGLELIQFKRKN